MKSITFVSLFLASWLLALPAVASPEVDTSPAEPGSAITRVYDLSHFRPSDNGLEGGQMVRLMPFRPIRFKDEEYMDDELEEYEGDEDMIRDALVFLMGDEEFERSGVFFDLVDWKIVITGPEALHQKVAATLAYLDSWLNRRVTLDFEIYVEKRSGLPGSADVAAVRQAAEKGLLEPILICSRTVVLGELVEFCEGSSTSVVMDYDVEIAQSSVVCEPILLPLFTGLRLAARPFLAPNGRDISIILAGINSRTIKPVETRDLRFTGRYCGDQFVKAIKVSQTIDDPRIEFASLYSVLPVKNGQPSMIRTTFPHREGVGSLVLIINARLAPMPNPPERPDGLALSAWDMGHLLLDEQQFYPFTKEAHGTWAWLDERYIFAAAFFTGPQGRISNDCSHDVVDFLLNDHNYHTGVPEEWSNSDYFRLMDQLLLLGTPEYQEDVATRAAALFCDDEPTFHTAIEFIIADGPAILNTPETIRKRGKLVGALCQPIKSGGHAISIAGLERLIAATYDVEVASNSAIADPRTVGFLDGVMIRLAHEPPASESGTNGYVQAQILLNCLNGSVESMDFGQQDGLVGIIDRPVFDHGFLNARFRTDGTPHLLGSLPLRQEGKPRTLYAVGQARSR